MIHSLSLKNTVKHSGKTFTFTEGLNLIQGQNEAGKSLLLEFIDFSLHGSQALRLPVSKYSSAMMVTLVVTIKGVKYQIERSTKKATIKKYDDGSLIATGTKPVDAEIKKILGYSRNVFLVSNYSSQDAINYLSNLKPAERKKTIDNVVGLTSVEEVIAEHKAELTILNRMLSSVKAREVVKPDVVVNLYEGQNLDELIEKYKNQGLSIFSDIRVQNNLSVHHISLDRTKPVHMEKPLTGYYIEGLTEQEIAEKQSTIKNLRAKRENLRAELDSLVIPLVSEEPNHSDIIPDLTIQHIEQRKAEINQRLKYHDELKNKLSGLKESQEKYSDEFIADVKIKEKRYHDWLTVQDLIAKGSVTCSKCGSEVLLAQEIINEKYPDVPEIVGKPLISSAEMLKTNSEIDHLEKVRLDLQTELSTVVERYESFMVNWYTDEQIEKHIKALNLKNEFERTFEKHHISVQRKGALKIELEETLKALGTLDDWYTPYQIEQHRETLKALNEYDQYLSNLAQWQKSKDAVEPFVGEDTLREWRKQIDELNDSINAFKEAKEQLSDYDAKKIQYDSWLKEHTEASDNVSAEKLKLDALNTYKQKIKTSILPSVNSVATQWLKRMSDGMHQKVELTEEMEILVNGEPIEALSISGRALGHLSLRMALGQVLTNHVFPVFMSDEVDASMRDERGQQVIDALFDLLNGSMKQIIMISHRKLQTERVSNFIEV